MQRLPTNEWIKEQLLIGTVSKELGATQPEVAVRIKELQVSILLSVAFQLDAKANSCVLSSVVSSEAYTQ